MKSELPKIANVDYKREQGLAKVGETLKGLEAQIRDLVQKQEVLAQA